jgi:hypothetical protein
MQKIVKHIIKAVNNLKQFAKARPSNCFKNWQNLVPAVAVKQQIQINKSG